MIAEFRVSNFFSIRSEQSISFVATSDKFMTEEYCSRVTDEVSLLKIGVIYGANASGKSNVLKALSYYRRLMLRVPEDRNEPMKLVPFLLDEQSRNNHCRMGMDFYLDGVRYVLNIEFDDVRIYDETLMVYSTNRPTTLYKRIYNKEKDATEITFSNKTKLTQKSQTIIEGNTVNN
jgi:AAA15 family ATPase/GTPase